MSTVLQAHWTPAEKLPWDRSRGRQAMLLFIATEAMLFAALFFSYFYLARQSPQWPPDEPPKLMLALIMLAILLASSGVLYGAEHLVKQGRHTGARLLVLLTAGMGAVFLYLQTLEYAEHFKHLRPGEDAYASAFYTLTSVHGAHVTLGVLILLYAARLPLGPEPKPPHKPLRTAALYWHFVDLVWVLIVALLYLLPRLRGLA